MMSYANITIEINGVDVDAEVCFTYAPEAPAKLHGHPDERCEAEPEEFELLDLELMSNDASFLLCNEAIVETIIESIKESCND